MSLIELMFNAVFNVLNIYIYFRVAKLFVSKKNTPIVLQTIIYSMVWLTNCIVHFCFNNLYLITISMFIILFTAILVLYDGSVIGKLLAAILTMAFGIVFEEFVWRLMSWLGDSSPNKAAGSLLSSFLYIVFVLLVERFFCVEKAEYISKSSYYNLVLILTGSIILLEVLVSVEEKYEWILIGLSAICLINISTFFYMTR